MNTTEEIEKFLERDIIEYLDKIARSNKVGEYKSEEYIEKVKENLKIKDTVTTIKILQTAIQEFNETTPNDPYKEIRLKQIIEMNQIMKKFCEKNPEATRLKHVKDLLTEELEEKQNETNHINVFEKIEKEKKEIEKQKEEKYYLIKKKLSSHLTQIKKSISIAILKKDINTAIKRYKQLKQIFTRYPSIYIEEKKEIYNDMISYYMQIKKTMNQIKQRQTEKQQETQIKDIETKENYQQLHLENIQKIINSIKTDTKNKEFEKAKNKIIELKHIASQIPDKHKIIRQRLQSKIDLINQRIEFIKRHEYQKNRGLQEPFNNKNHIES